MILFISTSELIFILFIALMLFGSDKIPSIARSMGKGLRQLKDATNEIKQEINKSAEKKQVDDTLENINKEIEEVKNVIKRQ